VAWQSYIDPDTPEDCKLALEKELDDAQTDFESEEFQAFKKTIKDYKKHWNRTVQEIRRKDP
jgi:hypothetical protein